MAATKRRSRAKTATTTRGARDRRYGTKASREVEKAMHEMKHGTLRSGGSGKKVTSRKQAIAIGLSKARRSGVKLAPPRGGKTSARTRQKATSDYEKGQSHSRRKPSARRSRATTEALKKEGRSAASHRSLSRQAQSAARKRGSTSRRNAAKKASRTRRSRSRSRS